MTSEAVPTASTKPAATLSAVSTVASADLLNTEEPEVNLPLVLPDPAEAVILSFVEAQARLARTKRDAVREAGAIAPLVALLSSGSTSIQGLVAAVLKDVATDNPANREAILKFGGLERLVEMASGDVSIVGTGEAAGALRALSSNFMLGCSAIVKADGIKTLIDMVGKGRDMTQAPIYATGALANLAQASEQNCEAILHHGGVQNLVRLLQRGETSNDMPTRRVAPEMKLWLEKAGEEAANALWELSDKGSSSNTAICNASVIQTLVNALVHSGLKSATANYSVSGVYMR